MTRSSLARYGVALLLAALALLFAWPGLSRNLLATGSDRGMFMTHVECYLWEPSLIALHVTSDFLIGISYVAISLTLAYLINRTRRDIPFHWVFLAFGLFIIACGATHFMEVWAMRYATYWLTGYIKLVTAAASLATAVVLPPLIPKTVTLVHQAKLSEERQRNLVEANAELAALYERVRGADELKTKFFANVSHELRTPLALILGPAGQLLAAGGLDARQRRAVELIDLHARGLLKQVNELLDVSKIEAGGMAVDYAEFDLAHLARQTASQFGPLAAERRISYRIEVPDAPLRAEADPDKLQRVLLNLLSNAFKFTPEGGAVRCVLRAGEGRDAAVLEVGDTGPGVPAETRESVFDRYGQTSDGLARHFGGTGLGLAIVREFVELHGGRVSVGDAGAGGALFRVELPLRAPAGAVLREDAGAAWSDDTDEIARPVLDELRAARAAESPRAGVGTQAGGAAADGGTGDRESRPAAAADTEGAPARPGEAAPPLVLVVEDNVEMNRFVADALSAEYRVESAFDGGEGLDKALALSPDLILSDVMMPRMGGEGLVRELRARPELDSVPVVMLTAKADDELRVRLLRGGAQDYLMKPFSVEELSARVGNLVAMKRAADVLRRALASGGRDLEELARDVAARKRQLEAALEALRLSERGREELLARERAARREAEEANRLKDEFLATVSHELRLPLTPIIGWAQMLLTARFDEETTARALDAILRNAREQERVVADMLDASRMVTGKMRFEVRRLELAPVVEAAVETARPAADAKGVLLELAPAAPLGPVTGDAERLRQVFWNLFANSVKFTPPGGRVRVRLAREDSHAVVTVSDTGEGIPPEFLPHVFDPFRQADSSTKRNHQGLGLGLSIVRHLVEMHGGTVGAESAGPGRGATFTVRLPLARPPLAGGGDESVADE